MSVQHRRREKVVIAAEDAGERLDRVLAARIADLSRSRLKALILAGEVAIGGRTIRDPGHHVNAGDAILVEVPPPEPPQPAPEDIPLKIVFEDDEIIVIDKPKGLVVHPAAGNWTGTLVNALVAHCGDSLSGIGGVRRPGIVHRLDKDTTGLLVVAKTDRAHASLSRQFADHGRTGVMQRAYLAFVWGVPDRPKGTIEAPIGRHRQARDKMAVHPDGRAAVTHWRGPGNISRLRRSSGGQPAGLPAHDRAHAPDSRSSGLDRPSSPGRRHLWIRLSHQDRPVSRRRRARRWQGLEDRLCMLICWGSNIHPGAHTWSSVRNCRTTLPVYVSASVPGAQPADFGKRSENQRLDARRKGHSDVTRAGSGVSFFRPIFSCNVAAAVTFRGRNRLDGTVGSGSGGAIRPPVTGAQHWRALPWPMPRPCRS